MDTQTDRQRERRSISVREIRGRERKGGGRRKEEKKKRGKARYYVQSFSSFPIPIF